MMHCEEQIPLVVPPAVAVVDRRRPGRWRRQTVGWAVAGALLLLVAMAGLSGIHKSQTTSVLAELPVSKSETAAEARTRWFAPPSANTRAARAHRHVISLAQKRHKTSLAPSKLSSLAEYMQDKSPHDFPLLAASEVKRAMVCPQNSICSFEGDATMSMYTEVEQFDPHKQVKHSDSQSKTDLNIFFDIFETRSLGCIHGHVTYGVNITKVETKPAVVHEHSDDKGDVDKEFQGPLGRDGENEMMMRAFTANPFYFVQDSVTGHYVDFVVTDAELPEVTNVKRSIINGLNPVINLANQYKAVRREDGAMLFQLAFRGINGFQRTVYSIKPHPTEEGTHEIQHFSTLIEEEGGDGEQVDANDEENVDGEGQYGEEKDADFTEENIRVEEPESCPYKTPTKETQIGKSSGTAKVKGAFVEEETNDADMKVGQDAAKKTNPAPPKNAAVDEDEQGQEPVRGQCNLVATYKAVRLKVTPYMSPCLSSMVSAQVGVDAPNMMTLAHFRQAVPHASTVSKSDEDEDTSEGADTAKLVRRPFTAPIQVEDTNEYYKGDMSASVKALVQSVTSNPDKTLKLDQANDLRRACDQGAFRRGVLSYLKDDSIEEKPQFYVALRFLGACEASANKKGTQEDLVKLAQDETARKGIRSQALMSLADVKCPFLSTITSLHELSQHRTPIGHSSMLILGAMLRSSRLCMKARAPGSTAKVQSMERGLNEHLEQALRDGRHSDAQTILYAMANSGADHHFHTLKAAMQEHGLVLRSIDLQHAALTAIDMVGYASTGKPDGGPEHQQLMKEISNPLDPAKDFPEEQELVVRNTSTMDDFHKEELAGTTLCGRAGQANIFCYSKRLPEDSTVNTLNEVQLGLGQGVDANKQCVQYADAQASAAVEVNTGIPIPGLDPLTIPILVIQGQFFFKKTGKKLGGELKLLGVVVYSFGSELLEPCVNKNNPPSLLNPDWFSKTVHEPPSYYGYCGFDSTEFDGITKEKHKHWEIPFIHGRFYMIGPVKLSIYAYFVLQWQGGLTIASEDRHWKLKDGAKSECNAGGFAGNLMNEVFVRLDIGGEASIGIFMARLGLEIKIFNVEARGTGELLADGFGKEVNFELSALSGAIVAKLYSWTVSCHWGGCAARLWGACLWRHLHCNSGYELMWGTTLWSWEPAWTSGNLFCKPPRLVCYWWHGVHCYWSGTGPTFGCPVYVPSPIATILHNIASYACLSGTTTCSVTKRGEYLKQVDVAKGARLYKIPSEHSQALKIGPAREQSLQSYEEEDVQGHGDGPLRVPGQNAAASEFEDCDYIQANSYRGYSAKAGDGQECLPWPKGFVGRYFGEGLAENPSKCDDLPASSLCWDACVAEMETNNFCRAPDDAGVPYCRTDGTDEAPIYSKCTQLKQCKQINEGCTHDKLNGEDYTGPVSWTASGKTCDYWSEYQQYGTTWESWKNECRNPNGMKKTAWCMVKESAQGWEFCNVGLACDAPEASQRIIDEVVKEGEQIARQDREKLDQDEKADRVSEQLRSPYSLD